MQTHTFCVMWLSISNGLPLELQLLPRTRSDAFCNHFKTVLFDHAGVGRISEEFPLKGAIYIYISLNESFKNQNSFYYISNLTLIALLIESLPWSGAAMRT